MMKEFNTLLEATREEIRRNPNAEDLVIGVEYPWRDKFNDVMGLYQEYMENLHWELVFTVSLYDTLRIYIHKTNGLDKD